MDEQTSLKYEMIAAWLAWIFVASYYMVLDVKRRMRQPATGWST